MIFEQCDCLRQAARAAVHLAALAALLVPTPAGAAGYFAFVTTTDYITGSCATVDLDGSYGVSCYVAPVHSDALARYHDGYFYVINRAGADNIQILDPENGFATVRQFSTGNGSNPQDVAIASPSKMYVTRYESNTLWIMNPQTGAQTGAVDLSAFADADGLCEMQFLFMYRGRVFVTIQRMDRNNFWAPSGTSYVAVIDVATDTLIDADPATPGVQAVTLASTNPFSEIQLDPWTGRLYVACAGYWGLNDGGIELIDPALLVSVGTMLSETAAAGDVLDAEIVDEQVGYCLIQNASFHTDLVRFDPATGTKTGTIYAPGDWVLQDIELAPTGELFLADRTAVNPGLRVFDAATGLQITTDPIDVCLPPFDITFNVEVQTAAENSPPAASLGRNYPNPFNPSTMIPFALEHEAHATLAIFDVTGARVATLIDAALPAGGHQARWDGRDDRARPVPSGVYFARLRTDEIVLKQKLLLLK